MKKIELSCFTSRIIVVMMVFTYFTGHVSGSFIICDTENSCLSPDAKCIEGICQCDQGKVLSLDGTKCLDVVLNIEGTCSEDVQCAPLLGKYACKSNKCQCDTGYRYLHGKCIKASVLGESCTKNEDCFVSPDLFAMVCKDSTCACNTGYYARGEYDCRPLAQEYGEPCAMDSDCQNLEDAICDNGCVKKSSTDQKLKLNRDQQRSYRSVSNDEPDTTCNTNEDCDKNNTYCSPITKKCVCKIGYFYHSKAGCIGELGVNVGCNANSECTTTPRLCQDQMCICPKTHFYKLGLDGCVKAGYKANGKVSCTEDVACNVWGPRAFCAPDPDDQFSSYCTCPFGTILNKHSLCETDESGCEAECTDDEDCTTTPNSICDKGNGVCICPEGFRLEENACLPNLGSKCDEISLLCNLENSECVMEEEKCACLEDYVQTNEVTCLPAVGLHDECSNNAQCVRSNTECIKGKCECMNNYVEIDNICIMERGMGDYCTSVAQCQPFFSGDVLCRNNKCQCPAGFKPTNDKKGCKPSGTNRLSYNNLLTLLVLIACYLFRG